MNRSGTIIVIAVLLTAAIGRAEDWPTYRHDNRRSGASAENLRLPLKQIWQYDSPSAPAPAWAKPARWNAFSGMKGLKHMRDFDSVFHVTIAGGRLFFGSSVDDAAHCLDAASGKPIWTVYTDAPVRLPPTIAGPNAYFGSDDGRAYCVKASDGSAVWKYDAAVSERFVPSNGKMISLWPVRTGVLVAGDKAYFAASLLPWRKSNFCGVDAKTGAELFKTVATGHAMQGAMLASDTQIFLPQGRSGAVAFWLKDGKFVSTLGSKGDGGVHAALTQDAQLIYGPGSKTGALTIRDSSSKKRVGVFAGASRVVIADKIAYIYKPGSISVIKIAEHAKIGKQIAELQSKQRVLSRKIRTLSVKPKKTDGKAEAAEQVAKRTTELDSAKLEQKKISEQLGGLQKASAACFGWKASCPQASEMIIAGKTIYLGAENAVHALSASDGKLLWTGKVDGKAAGLAVAAGRFYASTDKGKIHCFTPGK